MVCARASRACADQATLVRYADDFVMLCSKKDDAQRVMDVLPKRFEKYGLTLHPDKTRLVAFRRPDKAPPGEPPVLPSTLLGFTIHWARSRAGKWVVKSRTAKDRFARALQARRDVVSGPSARAARSAQWTALSQKLRGHYGYYGITSNMTALKRFRCGSSASGGSGSRAAPTPA